MANYFTIKEDCDGMLFRLDITRDKLEAFLDISVQGMERAIEEQEIIKFLEKNKVVYGIDFNAVKEISEKKTYSTRIKVASGRGMICGKDEKIIINFRETAKREPQIDDQGRIDFKELNKIENVNKGYILAIKEPPTTGESGMNIYGEEIPAIDGKKVEFKAGKNVIITPDGSMLISDCDGSVDYKDGWISVNKTITIEKDVDNSTGNIRFNGDVVVNGDVKTGFLVQAEGNILVRGVVEGAILVSAGDIVVEGGIQGNEKASVHSSGNLICKFIENAKKVISERDITADFVMHSNISCMGSLNLIGKKALLAGGEVLVKKEIAAATIGSPMGTKTVIELGVDENLKIKLQAYVDEKESVEKNLSDICKSLNAFKVSISKGEMDEKKKKLLEKTVSVYNNLTDKLKIINSEIDRIQSQMQDIISASLKVKDTIYPGVRLTIGNQVMYVRNEIKSSEFYLEDSCIRSRGI